MSFAFPGLPRQLTGIIFFLYAAFSLALLLASCQSPGQKNEENKPLSEAQKHIPENALSGLKGAEDLQISLFAHEPMLLNPTNMDIDEKGRVWVCEGYNYRYSLNPDNPYKKEGDRIVILEDSNGDGMADKQTVFYQGEDINSALGIAVLGNTVIVSRSPDVFVFTDEDNDGKADKKDTLFTGISGQEHDHAIHAFNFGPDGKLYFNFGNEGRGLKDKYGNPVKDISGKEITANGHPWRQGMAFRCDTDGKNVEVLGNNFRNPYEITEDSYGTLWQSDNDDDGNRGVRINYVMPYGNYGFTDEITGASWPERRINIEDSIPYRHWHLNDPGVVPNMLQTGAGSPTGILVYEGDLLPERFRGQLIHSDAGPNIVRSYAVVPDGAGYSATINNIAEGTGDNWFRPSDVCIAPDGSLFISDWYDPGVGGHQVKDFARGRIFRVTPKKHKGYKVPALDLSTTEGAVTALQSPNRSTRYLAWQKINSMGEAAAPALEKLYTSENPRFRARALWLLSKIPNKGITYVQEALKDKDPNIRITALRAALQVNADTIALVKTLLHDENIQVKREAALALHRNSSDEAPAAWAQLAQQYDGKDRWYLEALGIAAEEQWDRFFNAWLQLVNNNWNTPAGKDIVWRARAAASLPLLAKIVSNPAGDPRQELKFFRAFDFYKNGNKQKVLLSLLEGHHPQQGYINAITLLQLDPSIPHTTTVKHAIENGLNSVAQTQLYIDLVRKFRLKGKNTELLKLANQGSSDAIKADALRLLLESGGSKLITKALLQKNDTPGYMISLLGKAGSDASRNILQQFLINKSNPVELRTAAVRAFSTGRRGETSLLELVKNKKLPKDLEPVATDIFTKTHRKDLKQEAAQYLAISLQTNKLPPPEELMAMQGNADSGAVAFTTYCGTCHQVKEQGIAFGPDLSEIGSKLSKEALYTAILEPSAGISFGFEGYAFKLKTGATVSGYIASQTEDEISIKMIGGIIEKYRKADIVSKTQYDQSLMPEGLAEGMGAQRLANVVTYLEQLRKK
ncbi:PVC-type heme-binding CxxCH protein [Agriterribacter sp.]|uniref:PVC-type heme-binding CxxCH protein n=1 Tax=Agriterribacter sp. TaxID=2821509 RepID=UPI002BEE03DD|nr:PVC-type heme-binding CxxCH protein [Agriterribacter sp.]HRO44473.1 HEAT repeat domain-containing protein [Agriterribacter sp.]HRQ16501.1 HEAT repeat domain-containing protein [Agriterribacter sp.]